jgi:hypothetical protein
MIKADVDLDFGNRSEILSHIDYTPAILEDGVKHISGIYITAIPQNPISGFASIDYKTAETLGYFKLDILNQSVYKLVKSPQHLEQLLAKEVNWSKLLDKEFVNKLVHIGNYADMIRHLPEPIQSIEHLAMFLAIIRPGKKHLQRLPWSIVEKSVWDKHSEEGYTFKKSHALSYAILVTLHMAALEDIYYDNQQSVS